jgi:hypothetical protein
MSLIFRQGLLHLGEERGLEQSLWIPVEDMVCRDKSSDDIRRWLEALEKVLIFS